MKTLRLDLPAASPPRLSAGRERQDPDSDAFAALVDGKHEGGGIVAREKTGPEASWQRLAAKLDPLVPATPNRHLRKETMESPAPSDGSDHKAARFDTPDAENADPEATDQSKTEPQPDPTTKVESQAPVVTAPVVLPTLLASAPPASGDRDIAPRKGEPGRPQTSERDGKEAAAPRTIATVAPSTTPDPAKPKPLGETETRPWSAQTIDPAPARPFRDPPAAAAKLTVVSAQNIPAPAPLAPPVAALVEGLSSPQGAPTARVLHVPSDKGSIHPSHSLQIQLKPAELGVVTAQLRLSGDALSVDIQVETAEAYHRLSSDREAIVSALRAIGHDIDMITIRPPAATATDAQPGSGQNPNRQPGQAQGNHDGQNSQSRHGNPQREDRQRTAPQPPAPAFGAADRDMYI